MSVSTFFEKTKAQMKNAVSTHPIEIFMITAFAIGIWFVELGSHQGNDHLAYWIFAPILFIFLVHILGIVFHGLYHWWHWLLLV